MISCTTNQAAQRGGILLPTHSAAGDPSQPSTSPLHPSRARRRRRRHSIEAYHASMTAPPVDPAIKPATMENHQGSRYGCLGDERRHRDRSG